LLLDPFSNFFTQSLSFLAKRPLRHLLDACNDLPFLRKSQEIILQFFGSTFFFDLQA